MDSIHIILPMFKKLCVISEWLDIRFQTKKRAKTAPKSICQKKKLLNSPVRWSFEAIAATSLIRWAATQWNLMAGHMDSLKNTTRKHCMTGWLPQTCLSYIPKKNGKSWSSQNLFFVCIRDVNVEFFSCLPTIVVCSCVALVVRIWATLQLAFPLAPAQAGQ